MRKLWRRIYFLLNRQRVERELVEEMEIHRDMMPPDDRGDFGNPGRLQEQSRDAWTWTWLENIFQDLSYGARLLIRSPGFTLGAIAILALGVGVNLAEFQVFDALIFHRLTIRDAGTALQFTRVTRQGPRLGFPPAAVDLYRSESKSFAWLLAEDTTLTLTVESDSVRAALVSPDYFSSLGIVPSWGRMLDAHDSEPGAPAVAALGYQYWQTNWGADPSIVGRTIRVNNQPVQIAGVLPYDFDGLSPRRTSIFLPIALRPLLIAGSPALAGDFSYASEALYGKLKPGVPAAAANAELTALTRELSHVQPRFFNDDDRMTSQGVEEALSHNLTRSPAIAVFMVMIFLVLISACANLGNMLVARGLTRQREISIRIAIGASRTRIVRQLMTENFLLAILAAAAGLVLSTVAARTLLYLVNAPPDMHVSLRWPAFVAGFVLVIVSAIAFGIPSSLQIVNVNRPKNRLRQSLIGLQVAVSCLLLIASAVMAHNGILLASIDIAFDYEKMIVVDPQFYTASLPPAIARQKLEALSERLAVLPGIDQVTSMTAPPLSTRLVRDTMPGLPSIIRNAVAPSFFSSMGLPVLRGQTFLPGELNAVIVNQSAAHAIWPGQDPVGKTWTYLGADRVVEGVVKDSGANLLADPESIEVYVPLDPKQIQNAALVLHSRADPATLLRVIPQAVASVNQTAVVSLMRTSRDNYILGMRSLATLIGSIGLVASVLAAAGMFALVAFTVAQRRREFGIRIAIGAGPRNILSLLLTQNAKPVVIGLIAGGALAVVLARIVHSEIHLPNGNAIDLTGFASGIASFLLITALAVLSPAMRALKIDPSATLRDE